MTRQALLDLAARCESATGADRELDAAIAKAVGADHGQKTGWCNGDNGDYFVIDECSLHYTASLNAAMTLVPEGWTGIIPVSGGEEAWLWPSGITMSRGHRCNAHTPALALTDACLRALAQEIEHDN